MTTHATFIQEQGFGVRGTLSDMDGAVDRAHSSAGCETGCMSMDASEDSIRCLDRRIRSPDAMTHLECLSFVLSFYHAAIADGAMQWGSSDERPVVSGKGS